MREFVKDALLVVAAVAVAIGIALALPHHRSFNAERSVVFITNGSGVYIGNGNVITAAHVADEADENGNITIKVGDAGVIGHVQWMDEVQDVAVVHLQTALPGVEAATLACSYVPTVGDTLEVIGNPLELLNIHTWGHVAAQAQQMNIDEDHGTKFVADVTIAPGNSGGPVFHNGSIVGIADAMAAMGSMFGETLFPLAFILPSSVICNELTQQHPAPVFRHAPAAPPPAVQVQPPKKKKR